MKGASRSTPRPVFAPLLALTLLLGLGPLAGAADTAVDAPPTPGRVFEEEPAVLPGGLPPASAMPVGDLTRAIELFRAGEHDRARAELETFLSASPPKDGEYLRANFLLGYLYMQREDWQLASLHFYRVRTSEHPLTVYAAYYEAYVDYRRGKYSATIPECEEYRGRFPQGPFYQDCELLIADAHREWGHATTAITLYKAFLEHHDEDHYKERLQVSIARAYEVAGNATTAARIYSNLTVSHQYSVNGVAAEEGLQRLADAGVEIPEWTDNERWVRANTLKNTYRWNEAYTLFLELMAQYKDQPESEFYKRLEDNEYSFKWQTRQYGAIARESVATFEESGSAEHLDRAISAYNKGGDFVNAAKYAEIALARFGAVGRFSGIEQDIAWYYTNATRYDEAVEAWSRCHSKHKQGFYRWMVAYTTYRAGRHEEAIDALTPLVDQGGTYAQSARFYRAKCNMALNRLGTATTDFNAIINEEPYGWYAQVIQSRRRRASDDYMVPGRARDGSWPSPPRALDGPIPEVPATRTVGAVLDDLARGPFPSPRDWSADPPYQRVDVDGRPLPAVKAQDDGAAGEGVATTPIRHGADWASVRWPLEAGEPAVIPPLPPPPSAHATLPMKRAGVAYDEAKALETFAKFADSYEEIWPQLPAVYELTRLGMRKDAAALLHGIFEEVKDAQSSRTIRNAVRTYVEQLDTADDSAQPAPLPESDPDAGPSADKIEPQNKAMLPPLRDEERWRRMMDIRTSGLAWRDLFILVGAPHEMHTFSVSVWSLQATSLQDAEAQAAWRQGWPLAYGEQTWRLCQGLDLDPMMIFSLMRQESTYHPTIVSPAGAIGVMQIMPGTGAKVASLARYGPYSVERLGDPEVNVYFGIWYLSRLLARYDGQFPLAIGSYNGGPHNIGRWLRSKHNIGLEEFIEEIPFNETRDYIKKVVRNYATYLAIYDPDAFVQLPRTTRPDNPEIIDF